MQNLKKNDLWFGKLHEKFGKLLSQHAKSQNWDFDGILLSKVQNL